jgi:uncharacterized protein (DUF983 family)
MGRFREGHILRSARLFGRALLLRCPRCGRAPVLDGWFGVRPRCTVCGLRFDRGEPDRAALAPESRSGSLRDAPRFIR